MKASFRPRCVPSPAQAQHLAKFRETLREEDLTVKEVKSKKRRIQTEDEDVTPHLHRRCGRSPLRLLLRRTTSAPIQPLAPHLR
jgi:hypothetical protein